MPPLLTGDVAMAAVPTTTGPAARTRILLIEDERGLTEALTWTFQREGYEVLVAGDGQEGLRRAQTLLPDLIILDIMLPGLNGLEVCRELRAGERTRDIPIIILSAKAEETDQVVGFSLGADDYVTKPFSPKVLLQRIKALQRRFSGLTPTEFRLLECMLRQPGRAFTRHQLMDAAIGEGAIVLERTIDVHIKTLRRKLGTADLIETVRGVGYRFREKAE
jgi:two-component system phosphate regulon response regulator PhoB